jgi:autotransporter-associated beta strand protein
LTGGTLVVRNGINRGQGTATFNFGGGTLQVNGKNFSSMVNMTLTGIDGDATVDTAGYNATFSKGLSGPGGLNKIGAGKLTLSANNTYAGGTTISGGTLAVNNTTGSGTGASPIVVNSAGTLSGTGRIAGAIIINAGGTLAPGDNYGTLTAANTVTFKPGSNFSIEVNSQGQCGRLETFSSVASVALNGTLSLSIDNFTPTGKDIFFVINNSTNSATIGRFQYADDEKIGNFNGYDWFITYDANKDNSVPSLNGGNDVAIYSVVPEPSQMMLLIFACSGFLFAWRKR